MLQVYGQARNFNPLPRKEGDKCCENDMHIVMLFQSTPS